MWGHIWVATRHGGTRPSDQVFLGHPYGPAEDWESNAPYCPDVDFVSPEYVQDDHAADALAWREFFLATGVRIGGLAPT